MNAPAKVDVLAVMDAAVAGMEGPVRERRGHKWQLAEARAAVAELIEAVGRGTPTVSHSPHGPALIFPAAEAAALRAALVRVGGEA